MDNLNQKPQEKIYITVREMMQLFSIGRNKALKLGIDANAKVKLGKKNLYNVEKVKDYLANL